eukprot:scaffold369_cov281-Pinguiococcus_pyrenoidosus.AAC.1
MACSAASAIASVYPSLAQPDRLPSQPDHAGAVCPCTVLDELPSRRTQERTERSCHPRRSAERSVGAVWSYSCLSRIPLAASCAAGGELAQYTGSAGWRQFAWANSTAGWLSPGHKRSANDGVGSCDPIHRRELWPQARRDVRDAPVFALPCSGRL